MAGFPFRDGKGPAPDSWTEAIVWIGALIGVSAVLVFTGVDAQVEYVLTSPAEYTGLSAVSTGNSSDVVRLDREDIQDLNFVAKNRIGVDSVGSEIGFCGGIRDSGDVYELRVADGIVSSSRDSVTFSCSRPRSWIAHTQPGFSSTQSAEDKSFDGEFVPEMTCIVYAELVASVVSDSVSGINCFEPGTDNRVPVFVK